MVSFVIILAIALIIIGIIRLKEHHRDGFFEILAGVFELIGEIISALV